MRINCRRKLAVQYPSFFCFVGLMKIFSLATWRPALSPICGGGGERALKNSIYRLLYLGLCAMEFRQKFCAILNSSGTFFFFFFLGPVFFLVFNHGLFSFLFFAIHDTKNEYKRKLGVNKSQVANVNK